MLLIPALSAMQEIALLCGPVADIQRDTEDCCRNKLVVSSILDVHHAPGRY
jgi:hypothetical protein